MTDTLKEPVAFKKPSHIAYQVRNRDGSNAIWTRIGCAWRHADDQGFTVQFDSVPLDGRITLRIATEKKD